MDIWQVILAMIAGGIIMALGVLIGAAAAVGSRNTESEDIDIP